jgi:hypothetical protein
MRVATGKQVPAEQWCLLHQMKSLQSSDAAVGFYNHAAQDTLHCVPLLLETP